MAATERDDNSDLSTTCENVQIMQTIILLLQLLDLCSSNLCKAYPLHKPSVDVGASCVANLPSICGRE